MADVPGTMPEKGEVAAPAFLSGGGDMGERIRGFDWSAHPFGPPATWPAALRTALSICLHSSFPTAIYWGPELRLLYNDAWAPIPADRHPWALGRQGMEVWADIWDVVGPQFDAVLRTGEGFSAYDQMLAMERNGVPRETYWNYSFTPIVDDDGAVLGVLNQGHETTAKVLTARDNRAEVERMREMVEQAPAAIALLTGQRHVITVANPAYRTLVGGREVLGKTVADALPEVVEQGFIDLLDAVRGTGVAHRATGASVWLDGADGARNEHRLDFVYQPVKDAAGNVIAIFVEATDVTDRFAAEAALRESEERLHHALGASNSVGVWDWDVKADRVHADERFARHYGVDPERAAAGQPIRAFMRNFHPDDIARVSGEINAALASGDLYSSDYRLRRPDGSWMWVNAQGRAVHDADGRAERFLGVSFDITDRKLAEEELRRTRDDRDFVFELAERMRAIGDPDDIMQAAVETLGQRLGADRVGFFRYVGAGEIEFGAGWTTSAVKPLEGRMPVATLGGWVNEHLEAGELLVTDDSRADPNWRDTVFPKIGMAAGVGVPMRRWDRLEGGLYVHQAEPRKWTSEEIGLIEEVAQLSWDAMGRAEAVAELRLRNESLREEVEERTAERDRIWDVSQDLLLVSDTAGVWLAVNPALTTMLGWEPEDVIGRTSEWMEHPDDRAATRAEVAQLAIGETTFGFVNRFRARNGGYRTISWTAVTIEDRIYATGRDVTAEEEQRAELARSEQRTRLALSAINGVGTWTYRPDIDLFRCDTNFARLYGVDPTDGARGIPIEGAFRRIEPDDLVRLKALIAKSHNRPGDAQIEYRVIQEDGSVAWVLSRTNTSIGEGGTRVVTGVAVDITEQRRLEETLRQSQKMEAVGQLTGGLAHDFNNMLTGISGALEMMQLRIGQGRASEVPRYIDAAQGAAKRAAALTHRLLAFSRRQTLDPRPVDPGPLITGLEEIIRRAVGPAHDIGIDIHDGVWRTRVDPNQLENALLNLCINARDAMPEGGHIEIVASNQAVEEADARAWEMAPGDYVVLCVADEGSGMSPEVIARAFDPFFTTKPLGEGTGLGLSMIYGFARQSGGAIRIESALGKGTVMRLYLPRHHGADAKGAAEGDAQIIPRPGRGRSVLVVDDEPTVRMLVTEQLAELGYSAIEAADGAGALAILGSQAVIDLLVTDVGLPGGMNGRQVAEAARMVRPELKVLFVTGFAEQSVLADGELPPGMGVMTKPFTMDVLAARIDALVSG
ncbi:PAS domain S-box protein [Sphingomonas gilva]|uniref:histidine kinase n=1 Tax=Sphingomonas gilva TaxID=2305907 RepID=A0A396RJJ7_9SPHN|nr:PAS domain-containing protein [Sphingomonas gilva]RHW16337.1 PAS domain S-box protein [Sphingomonas gilva]